MSTEIDARPANPVPAKWEDWARKVPFTRTLNDMVEELHIFLFNSESDPKYAELSTEYRGYLDAVYDEQAVEGDTRADDHEAARIIRKVASERGSPVARQKLSSIRKALNTVLSRYGQSRRQRRSSVGGVVVADIDREAA
jgi:hypothetical protein